MTDQELLDGFETCTLPFSEWTHRAHVKVAFIYLERLPYEQALQKLFVGIRRYNAHNKVPESPTSGYNQTTTHAFTHLIAATRLAYGGVFPVETADAFCDAHPQLMTKHILRLFYSPERRTDPRAKSEFVQPDLAPLPVIEGM